MPLVRSRAPVIDTSQEPRREPVIIWVDHPIPATPADRCVATALCAVILLTALYFGWQMLVRA